MTGRIGAARSAAILLALVPSLLAGCAATRSATEAVAGWLGAREPAPRAYYVGAARAKLHREPEASSEVVGQLERNEGVLSYRVENGFAYVRAEGSGRSGWVRSTDLVDQPSRPPAPSRAPAREAPPAEAGTSAAPSAPPPSEGAQAPAEPAPQPEGEPESPEPSPEKSVFDPY